MTTFARGERAALCDTLEAADPNAPTLNEGWSVRDLAAHLVLREGRPDAFAGILVPALSRRTQRVQRSIAATDWPQLVHRLRTGPPRWSPMGWGPLHEEANLLELFVHHEDVRRAGSTWTVRPLPVGMEEALWTRLRRMAPVLTRRAPGSVVLELTSGGGIQSVTTHAGRGEQVTVRGAVSELVMYVFGRTAAADVTVTGGPEALERLPDSLGI